LPNLIWSRLNRMQLGRYAEYYAKMEFASYGFDVYTSEVDDHGVDFVAKPLQSHAYYEIQVKSSRDFGYVYIPKDKMQPTANRAVCYMHFIDGKLPEKYQDFSSGDIVPLMYPAGTIPNLLWEKRGMPTPTSMRSVDASCEVYPLSNHYESEVE
jgi:hypothetical protein